MCQSKSPYYQAQRKEWSIKNKDYVNEAHKQWCAKNPELRKRNMKNYRDQHKEEIRIYNTAWNKANMSYYNDYKKERYKTDAKYKLAIDLRARLNSALRHKSKRGSAVRDLGCSIDFFMEYISKQFAAGMTWENHELHGWHIDHIIPLSAVNLEDKPQLLKVLHFTNLRPMWAKQNLSKGGVRQNRFRK